jgi:hypothetical protein
LSRPPISLAIAPERNGVRERERERERIEVDSIIGLSLHGARAERQKLASECERETKCSSEGARRESFLLRALHSFRLAVGCGSVNIITTTTLLLAASGIFLPTFSRCSVRYLQAERERERERERVCKWTQLLAEFRFALERRRACARAPHRTLLSGLAPAAACLTALASDDAGEKDVEER